MAEANDQDPYVDEDDLLLPEVPPPRPAVTPIPEIGVFDDFPTEDLTISMEGVDQEIIPPPGLTPASPPYAGPEGGFAAPSGQVGPFDGVDGPRELIGRYEAFLARVRKVYYDAAGYTNGHPLARCEQAIDFERVGLWYDTHNEPTPAVVGPTDARPIPATHYAYPFPIRQDQSEYIVKRGDIVTIIQGEDRSYYLADELPFLAQVMSHTDIDYAVTARQNDPATAPQPTDAYIVGDTPTGTWSDDSAADKIAIWDGTAWAYTAPDNPSYAYASESDDYWKYTGTWATYTNVTEANAGGAGLLTLRVIRKALLGRPDGGGATSFADLQDADSVDIEYESIMPVTPANVSHNYRCGDFVWVFRRGWFLFCLPAPSPWLGKIQAGGPASEGDFATNHYWVREQVPTVTYSTNQWTASYGDKTQTDPTGSGGRYGRWVDAVNVAEGGGSHGLSAGDYVLVNSLADASSGETYYAFSTALGGGSNNKAALDWLDTGGYLLDKIVSGTEITLTDGGSSISVNLDGPVDPTTTVDTLGGTGQTGESALSDTWASGGANGLDVWVVTRVIYNDAGDEILYGYMRKFVFTATGRLSNVEGETRFTINAPDLC